MENLDPARGQRPKSNPNTTKHTLHGKHFFLKGIKTYGFLGGSQTSQLFIYCEQKTEKHQATNYITTIPFWTSKTCHARPADRDLRPRKWSLSRYDARWILQESSSTHTKYSPKKIWAKRMEMCMVYIPILYN